MADGKVIDAKDEHLEKVPVPMVVMVDGKVIAAKDEQSLKA